MDQSEQDRKALQDFIVDNAELEKLEALLDKFNIFEAVGMERQEIRHSKFLAFLLDPKESHGMGDAFVKRLLQRALMDSPNVSASVTPIELSLWNLGEMSVQREWRRIDIFLRDERRKLAVIIENKIDAGEHGDQLDRYYEAVRKAYPDHRLLALYLTPGDDEPSHPEYLPVSYRAVCEILDDLAESQAAIIEPDARVLITHYTEMLRRHIVGDSEIARLSREIYHKHRRAIDLIVEQRFAQKNALSGLLTEIIRETPNFSYLSRNNSDAREFVNFVYENWSVPELQQMNDQRPTVTLHFANRPDSLDLKLLYHSTNEEIRSRIFQILYEELGIFESAHGETRELQFFHAMLSEEFYENATDAEREAEIRKNWADFLENDLPHIDAALKQEAWIWEPDESEASTGSGNRFVWSNGDIEITQRPGEEGE